MRNVILLVSILLSVSVCAGEPPAEPIRINSLGVALDGYSPVSYFTSDAAEQGDPAFASVYEGATYWFTDQEQLTTFEADPGRYIPAHGGWCTLMMGGSGRRTPGHPESFAIVDDRLMLFWSGDTEETKGLGMRNWLSNTGGTLEGAREVVASADENWTRFLSGDRDARIYLYKESDKQAVSASQLETARERIN